MSRIGKAPIELPSGVELTNEGNVVVVKGPKGSLSQEIDPRVSLSIEGGV
ncbi:MAG: 50S ribosomal protein L6, partial [Acidimicrobiia bacterium]